MINRPGRIGRIGSLGIVGRLLSGTSAAYAAALTSMFASGETGGWWDATSANSLKQDTAGTVAVAAENDPVGYWGDISGRGNHLTQATAAFRPTFKQVGGVTRVDFDGTNDRLTRTVLDMTGSSTATIFAVLMKTGNAAVQTAMEWGFNPSGGAGGAVGVYFDNSVSGALGMGIGLSTGYRLTNDTSIVSAPRTNVAIIEVKPGQTPNLTLTVDGVSKTLTDSATVGTVAQMLNASRQMDVGSRADAGQPLYAGIVILGFVGRLLTASEKTAIQNYGTQVGGLGANPATPFGDTPTSFTDTAVNINQTTYYETSPFARVAYSTNSTTMRVYAFNNIYGTFPQFTEIGVVINGVYSQSLTIPASGSSVSVLTLAAGAKTVEFVNGLQSKPSSLIGSFVVRVEGNAAITRVNPSTVSRVVFLGDSITVGANSTAPTRDGYAMLLRYSLTNSIAVEGYGYGSVFRIAGDSTKRTATINRLTTLAPTKLYLALGTNDYGLESWTAAAFQTEYAAFLVAINTALPACQIYAQTPLSRSTEAANGSGSTLGDYRTAISNAASGKSYVTVVSGPSLLTTASLAVDGLHPTTAGHALLAPGVKTAMGL